MSSWISEKDRAILRELANRQAECHASPAMQQTIADWKAHGDFRGRRPMVMLEMNTFEEEILPGRLRCEGRRRAGWKRIFTAGCCRRAVRRRPRGARLFPAFPEHLFSALRGTGAGPFRAGRAGTCHRPPF